MNVVFAEGDYRRGGTTIRIDINSGIFDNADVETLAKYTMLRTFTHEFGHFMADYNASGWNELQQLVFRYISENASGKNGNVDGLIESYMNEFNVKRVEASEEVAVEALADILPQTHFLEMLYRENSDTFNTLRSKFKHFLRKIKAYIKQLYSNYIANPSKETAAAKVRIDGAMKYADDIVAKFDEVALGAVRNLQRKKGENASAENTDVRYKERAGAGYDGYSMSNNAREAYETGEKPISRWSKEDIIYAVSEINPNIASAIERVNLKTLKEKLLYKSSWHHTSSRYNKTDFYSIDEKRVEKLTEDEIKEWTAYKETTKATGKKYRGDISYIEWSGTQKHPKANRKTLTDVNIEERGSFYIVTDDSGNEILRKKIGSNGTSVTNYEKTEASVFNASVEDAERERDEQIKANSTEAAFELWKQFEKNGYEKSSSGNIYAKGRKPSRADYDDGVENFFKVGERRLSRSPVGNSLFSYRAETWNGSNWVEDDTLYQSTSNDATALAEDSGKSFYIEHETDVSDIKPYTEKESQKADMDDIRNISRFYNDVKKTLDNELTTNKLILVGKPSEVLSRYLENDRLIYIPQSIIKKIVLSKENGGKHNLGYAPLIDMLYQLSDPIIITKNTAEHQKFNDNSIVVIMNWTTVGGDSIITPIRIDANGNMGLYNNINSMFDVYDKKYESDLFKPENILYTKNNKDVSSLLTQRREVPKWKSETSSVKKISQNNSDVNSFDEKKYKNRRNSSVEGEREVTAEQLRTENEKLKQDVDYLNQLLDIQRNSGKRMRLEKQSVEKITYNLLRKYNVSGNSKELSVLLYGAYGRMNANTENLSWEEITGLLQPAVDWISSHIRSRAVRTDEAQEMLRNIKEYSPAGVYLSEAQRQEAAYAFGSLGKFRNRVFGTVNISPNAEMSLTQLWSVLSSVYPGIFKSDISEGEMVTSLADTIAKLRNSYVEEEAIPDNYILSDLYENYWNVKTSDSVATEANKSGSNHSFDG